MNLKFQSYSYKLIFNFPTGKGRRKSSKLFPELRKRRVMQKKTKYSIDVCKSTVKTSLSPPKYKSIGVS